VLALKLGRTAEALDVVERSRSRQFLNMLGEHETVKTLRAVVIDDPRLRHHVATGGRPSTSRFGKPTAIAAEQLRATQAKARSYYEVVTTEHKDGVHAAPGKPLTWQELRRLLRG
jgi:hypothetical protein